MTDVLKMGKKVLTIGVVATTILWSLGVAAFVAPLIAQAETTVTLTAGDVIKGASTKNVFYYAVDGKRYTFPTQDVAFSWIKDWSTVKTISDSQISGITIGGTIAYRPGTQLVKVQSDAKVYAVEPGGVLRWIESDTIAKALWGTNWTSLLRDVDPTIFPYVYTVSASSVNTATYPVGSLVKMGADYYLIGTGMTKRLVTAAGLTANNYQTKFAAVATDLSAYTTGTGITANEAALTTIYGAVVTGGVVVVPAGTGVTVSLASDTPAAATVVTDSGTGVGAQALIPALKLNFTASNDGDVVVKSVKLTRGGISADTDVPNMYLYDGDTQLANTPSVSVKTFTFLNSAGLFTVAKGTTKTITVKFDLANAAGAGKTISFAVAAVGDVVTNSAAVNGTFPVTGNIYTVASVTDLGKFTLTSVSPSAASNVDPGQNSYEIWRFTTVAQNQDVELRSVKFTIVGSVNATDLKNIALWDGGTQIGSTVAALAADKTVTLNFATPYVIAKGVTRTLSLRADIVGGSTRTFYFSTLLVTLFLLDLLT
ncbi:MAG: hypothetical protein NTU97_02535 [Candidatus Magasanikbacteria bacterium]|nr:hypothetical protein [Candidatus Magasanikbacteria bacterium]